MKIEQLNADYAIAGQLRFIEGKGGFPFIEISSAKASALVSAYAGQVLSFRPAGVADDLMFLSEKAYYQHFGAEKRYGFFTVGGNTTADAEFKREYQNEPLQIDLRDIKIFRRSDHVTIIKSMIITVRLTKGIAERIDQLYASGQGVEQILPEIILICKKPGKIRFVIENNRTKAEKMKKILARNFYFRRPE